MQFFGWVSKNSQDYDSNLLYLPILCFCIPSKASFKGSSGSLQGAWCFDRRVTNIMSSTLL